MIAPLQVSEVMGFAAYILLTHASCTYCDAYNLEQPTSEDAFRSIVLCKLALNSLRNIEGGMLGHGSSIRWWRYIAIQIMIRRCTRRSLPWEDRGWSVGSHVGFGRNGW